MGVHEKFGVGMAKVGVSMEEVLASKNLPAACSLVVVGTSCAFQKADVSRSACILEKKDRKV